MTYGARELAKSIPLKKDEIIVDEAMNLTVEEVKALLENYRKPADEMWPESHQWSWTDWKRTNGRYVVVEGLGHVSIAERFSGPVRPFLIFEVVTRYNGKRWFKLNGYHSAEKPEFSGSFTETKLVPKTIMVWE